VVSASSITAVISETGSTPQLCAVSVSNPLPGAGGNGATFGLAGGLGVGEASTVAPTITATNATTPIAVLAPATTVTLTGTGFSQFSAGAAFVGTTQNAGGVTVSNPAGNSGTSITFNVSAATGATAGPFNMMVSNDGATTTFNLATASNAFPAAVSVAGPVITSQTPTGLAAGAPVGTVVTLTGTGFTNTTTGTVSGDLNNSVISYTSATTMSMVLTQSPGGGDVAAPPTIILHQVPVGGGTVISPTFTMKIDTAPTVSGLTYTVGSDVGVGAVAQQVVIHGSGFATGATVGSFVNGNSVADPNVTATVTSINSAGTAITATIAIKAPDTNIADGYSVTNTDGGVVKVPATLTSLVIGPGPTITAVSPTPGLASATNAFTITGTGFLTGAVVTATSDGTCGTATVVSATSITASCTLGALQTTAVSLVVTNVDGGSATSSPVLTPSVTKPPAPFKVSGAHGHAVPGKTVTMTISGTGFYGQPRITSNAAGTRVTVSKDTGHLLTIRVTTSKTTKKGTHTFTIRLANGKTGKANYSVA
jgi:hypothetical protein